MVEKERDESGRFSRSVDDADVLGAVRAHDPAATSEIADEVGISRQGADRRLRSLREDGAVSSKKIGASLVWFIPRERAGGAAGFDPDGLQGDGSNTIADIDAEDTATTAGATETTAGGRNAESGRTRDESDTLAEEVRAYLDGTDTPPKTEHGRDAVIDVFRYLREHGATKTGELQDAVYPDYTEEWGSARTMWNAIDRYLENIPGIEKGGYGEWTYTGDDAVRDQLDGKESGIYDPTTEFEK